MIPIISYPLFVYIFQSLVSYLDVNDNDYSNALKKAGEGYEKLYETTLSEVLSVFDDRKLEKNKDSVTLVLAELMVEDEGLPKKDDYITIFAYVLKQILEYLGIQKSRPFFSDDKKIISEITILLVSKIKEYEEKKIEKKLQKVKKITDFKSKFSKLDFDYLKAFIERIGLSHFAALDLIAKIPILKQHLETRGIISFTHEVKKKLGEIEKNIWKDQEGLSPLKNALESLLTIAEKLPKLQHLLENKGLVLDYSELVDLLKIKHSEMSEAMMRPLKENLYRAIKTMTLMPLARGKHKKTKKNIAHTFATSINTLREKNLENADKILGMVPNLLTKFLNRLLKELKIIKDYLPQSEINNLLNKKIKEVEIDMFEAELESGVKPTTVFPSNLNTLSGSDFESFLEKLFKKLGYSVVKTPLTGDQGADLILEKNNERIAVQAKRYEGTVSNKAVQEVTAAINYYKCNRAIVVTTSTFTKSAFKLAASNKIELWNGKRLKEVMNTLIHCVATNDSNPKDDRIESLLPDKYKKCSMPKKLLTVRPQEGVNIQKIKTQCVFCEGEIEFSVDPREVASKRKVSFKTECPHCGNTMTINPQVATWKCQYCSEEFGTKKKVENHEKICSRRKK